MMITLKWLLKASLAAVWKMPRGSPSNLLRSRVRKLSAPRLPKGLSLGLRPLPDNADLVKSPTKKMMEMATLSQIVKGVKSESNPIDPRRKVTNII